MEFLTPVGPPIPFPNSFPVPSSSAPDIKGPEFDWEPIPIYAEDLNPIPTPNPRPAVNDGTKEDEDDQADSENREESNSTEGSGKPEAPPMDLVPEIAEIQTVELPLIGIEVPLPRTEILVTATTTAGVSSVVAVSGTLFATTMFRQLQPILKPIFKTVLKKLAALRKKPPPRSWSRQRLLDRRSAAVKKL